MRFHINYQISHDQKVSIYNTPNLEANQMAFFLVQSFISTHFSQRLKIYETANKKCTNHRIKPDDNFFSRPCMTGTMLRHIFKDMFMELSKNGSQNKTGQDC